MHCGGDACGRSCESCVGLRPPIPPDALRSHTGQRGACLRLGRFTGAHPVNLNLRLLSASRQSTPEGIANMRAYLPQKGHLSHGFE